MNGQRKEHRKEKIETPSPAPKVRMIFMPASMPHFPAYKKKATKD